MLRILEGHLNIVSCAIGVNDGLALAQFHIYLLGFNLSFFHCWSPFESLLLNLNFSLLLRRLGLLGWRLSLALGSGRVALL
mmetsp:Transcript_22576/g.34881  ORF Transcript_22576/g.34881 Transcript_22576/m.34881 type:complete len:81 (+) Transcript_22576:199-441(+)